jgi:hypothetical protein
MKSNEMINLELKEKILSTKIEITLEQAVKLACSLFNNICVHSIYKHSLGKTKFSFPGLFEVEIKNNTINLIEFIISINKNIYRQGVIEGGENKKKEIKYKFESFLNSIDFDFKENII